MELNVDAIFFSLKPGKKSNIIKEGIIE